MSGITLAPRKCSILGQRINDGFYSQTLLRPPRFLEIIQEETWASQRLPYHMLFIRESNEIRENGKQIRHNAEQRHELQARGTDTLRYLAAQDRPEEVSSCLEIEKVFLGSGNTPSRKVPSETQTWSTQIFRPPCTQLTRLLKTNLGSSS